MQHESRRAKKCAYRRSVWAGDAPFLAWGSLSKMMLARTVRKDGYVDVVKGEMVEKALDHLITRRDEKRRREEESAWVEDAWVESVRKHNARRDGERREAGASYVMA